MEFKGTKGKWHTDNNTTLGGKNSIIFSEEKGVIITLNQAYFDTDEEMIANALLISKAPEMLEMIMILLDGSFAPEWKIQKAKQLIKEATEL